MSDGLSMPVVAPEEVIADERATAVDALAAALEHQDLSIFYRALRATDLPFLCGELQDDAPALFRHGARLVAELAEQSPAVALAVENHLYVTSAIATFPTAGDDGLDRRRRRLLDTIVERRLLVANTNSKVHGDRVGELGTSARRLDGGGFEIDGIAAYTSLASEADLLVLMTPLADEGLALFAIHPLSGREGIEIGPYLFPRAMRDSDTRRLTFRSLRLPDDALVAGGGDRLAHHLVPFEMAWHQLLIAALYLGAASGALDEARSFLTGTSGRDGEPLAEMDGVVVDMGRLAVEHRAAGLALGAAGELLGTVRRLPEDAAALGRVGELASVIKYTGTRVAETLVSAVRRIVGARTYAAAPRLERLCDEVVFGSLGPEVSAVIERRLGRRALKERPFLDLGG